MKKIIAAMLCIVMCSAFCACSKTADSAADTTGAGDADLTSQTEPVTEPSTRSMPKVSTTAKAEKNKKKAKNIEKQVEEYFSADKKEVKSKSTGTFEFKQESLDSGKMYAQEYSDENQKAAEKNAEVFVASIKDNYPDSDKIRHFATDVKQVGTGDNGVDSVTYDIIYLNSQNQKLDIYADSNGEIFYVSCNFTW